MAGRPKGSGTPRIDLNEKEREYVKGYLRTASVGQAAKSAGMSNKQAKAKGHAMLKRPQVKAAIQAAQVESAKETAYTLTQSMEEAKEAMAFARETGNANALVKAIEHRAKLNGLLVENFNVRQTGLDIIIHGVTPEHLITSAIIPGIAAPLGALISPPEDEDDGEDLFD